MTYEPKYLRERSKQIINARNWGVGLITALLGLGMFISEVKRMQTLSSDPMNYAYLALFILSGALIFLWIWATQKELDLLFEWLDPERYEPPSSLKETILIIGFAILLIGLLFASRDQLLFGLVFTLYSFILIFTAKYLNQEIALAIDKSRDRVKVDLEDNNLKRRAQLYLEAINVLDFYFIKRPVTLRLIIIFVFSLIGLALAIWWKVTGASMIGLLSYLIFFLTILVSEVVIGLWRNVHDSDLRPIAAELREFLRNNVSQT